MAVHEGVEVLTESELQWICLTCNMCTIRCPMGVEFIDFIRDIRDHARDRGNGGKCTHGRTIRTWGEMMARDANQPARLGWLTQDLRVSQEGEIGYFVGCLPLYSQFFTGLAPDAVETARSAVRILNRLGIEPVVMGDEVCCGHDFLWSGDRKTFSSLAARNMEAIKRRGIKTLVTACAECFRTLKVDYPWGEAGHAYVFMLYGVHWAFNVVTGQVGEPHAVLVRAVEPLPPYDAMCARRGMSSERRELTSGPGRLTRALGLDGSHDGADLCSGGSVYLADDGASAPRAKRSARIGVDYAGAWAAKPWRFFVPGNRYVSGAPRG
jgi:DNA-3-methyladenine glycosylase